MLTLFIILAIKATSLKIQENEINCEYGFYPYFFFYQSENQENLTWSTLANFNTFQDLILDCNLTYNITEYLVMWPKHRLLLDESFKFERIFLQNKIDSLSVIDLGNLKGIDLNSKPFILKSKRYRQRTILDIHMSMLNIYSNSTLLDSNRCNRDVFSRQLTNFAQYVFAIKIQNSFYPSMWCPYFFNNFDLTDFVLLDIKNSFLIKNRLKFNQLNSSNVYLKHLRKLVLGLTYEYLDLSNLSSDLFRKIKYLIIIGVLNGIEPHLFKDFQDLDKINLCISNLKEVYHMGNQWMSYLNNLGKNLLRLEFRHQIRYASFDSIYEYPNEDLCLFKDFPHERAVYPFILPGKRLECTCTLLWLESKIRSYGIKIGLDYNLNYEGDENRVYLFCDFKTFNYTNCNFSQMFFMCQYDANFQSTHMLSFKNDDDIYYMIKFVEFILLVILQPIFCFSGIVHNFIIIFVIRNRNMKKDFQEAMYKHIIINAIFNIVYCLITTFRLINTCIFYGSSVFCSHVYQEEWAQNLKIIFINFLGNVTKMCSNLSYLIFSTSRLLLITKSNDQNTNGAYFCFSNRKMFVLIYILLLIFLSGFLSSFKLFQYRKNIDFDLGKEFPMEIRDEHYCNNDANKLECKLFNLFKMIYRSLNDLLFVILNIFIDLVLFVKFKKHMNSKLRQINDQAQRTLIEKSKKNLNRMILFNSFIYIFSHLPEFAATLMLNVYSKEIVFFCSYKFSCDLLNEEAEFFGLISMVCQFYVLKIFDKNFKRSLNEKKAKIYRYICNYRNLE
jgi:hypothetical protein